MCLECVSIFFLNNTATTEIYPLSLHDALPISSHTTGHAGPHPAVQRVTLAHRTEKEVQARRSKHWVRRRPAQGCSPDAKDRVRCQDRKSTRLNSSHSQISYAVFCLKKKKKKVNNVETFYISLLLRLSPFIYTISQCAHSTSTRSLTHYSANRPYDYSILCTTHLSTA